MSLNERKILAFLTYSSGLLLSALPIGMVIANKSAPVFFVSAILCALFILILQKRVQAIEIQFRFLTQEPFVRCCFLFIGWCACSLIWSIDPVRSTYSFVKFFGTFSVIFLAWTIWPLLIKRSSAQYWFLGGVGCALLLLAWEYFSHMSLHRMLAVRSDFFLLKRSSNALAFLFWPALFALQFYGSANRIPPWRVWGIASISGILLFWCGSGAAKLSLLMGFLTYSLGQSLLYFQSRKRYFSLRYIFGSVIVLSFLGAPLLGFLSASLPSSVMSILSSYHAQERILIWQEFSRKIWAAPFLGTGFDSSDRLNVTIIEPLTSLPFNLGSPAPQQTDFHASSLHALHPHNFPLQIWCELGIVGIFLALISLFYFLKMMQQQEAQLEVEKWTILMAAFALMQVSFSAWEAWWWVSLHTACLWHHQKPQESRLYKRHILF